MCVFARHNVAQDPPFSRLDLISCCNVLIYLERVLQRKVLSILHYALKPAGFLVLGPSESIGTLSIRFNRWKRPTRSIGICRPRKGCCPAWITPPASTAGSSCRREFIRAERTVLREADRLVLAEYAPPGAVIDDETNIVQVRGRTAPYLELSPGEPTQKLLKLARGRLDCRLG